MGLTRFSKDSTIHTKQNSDTGPPAKMEGITFTRIPSFSDTNFSVNTYSNMWGYVGLYTQQQAEDMNVPYSNGGVSDTWLHDLPKAFLEDGAILFQIPPEEYGLQLVSGDFRLQIPLTGTTTATTLYSAYLDNDDIKKIVYNSSCSGLEADLLTGGDPNSLYQAYNLGYEQSQDNNGSSNICGFFESNVVGLFSDEYFFTGTTTGLTSWSKGYGDTDNRKYSKGARFAHPFSVTSLGISGTSVADKVCGFFFPIIGIGFIIGDFVKDFAWGLATGGTSTTEVTFPIPFAACESRTYEEDTSAEINLILPQAYGNQTTNPSYPVAANKEGRCDGVYPTEFCFYSKNQELLVVAKPDPNDLHIKNSDNMFIYNFLLPMGTPIDYDRDSVTRGGYSGVFPCDASDCP